MLKEQWRSNGEHVRARALGCGPWGRNSTYFAVILNVFLSRNLDQSVLKNAYFGGKNVKIVSASRAPPPNPSCYSRLL